MTSGERALGQRRGVGAAEASGTARAACSCAGSSLRSLARSQPLWTNVSLPSGRTSVIVACRSTSGVEDLIHSLDRAARRRSSCPRRAARSRTRRAVPAGFWVQLYGGVAFHRPPVPPPVSPVKSVGGRAVLFHGEGVAVAASVGLPSVSAPPAPRYQERACVPGTGNVENECSNPGSGLPGRRAAGAVVEQDRGPAAAARTPRARRRSSARTGSGRSAASRR